MAVTVETRRVGLASTVAHHLSRWGRDVYFGDLVGRPGSQTGCQRLWSRNVSRVENCVVEQVKHQTDPDLLVQPQTVYYPEAAVVMFQCDSFLRVPWSVAKCLGTCSECQIMVVIESADMDDDYGLCIQLHGIEHLRQRREFLSGAFPVKGIGRIEDDMSAGVEAEAQALFTRQCTDSGQFCFALFDLAMKLCEGRMGEIGSEIGAEPVHADGLAFKIQEYISQIGQTDRKMW